MAIPFDADWRLTAMSADTTTALTRWATIEPALAGADLETLRNRAAGRDVAESDTVVSALLRLASTDNLARRVIVEALMGRLVPIATTMAPLVGEPYDDVLVELAGWAWELAASNPSGRWTRHLAPNLARLAKRRYLATRTRRHVSLGDRELPAPTDAIDERLGVHDAHTLLARAVADGTITPAAARVLSTVALTDASDRDIATHLGRSEQAVKKVRERALARLRSFPPTIELRAA